MAAELQWEPNSVHVMGTYKRWPLSLVKGEGSRVWDSDGNEYLDFTAGIGVLPLGHNHPSLKAALARQAEELWHCSNLFQIPAQAALAAKLAELSGLDQAFFANSGAEANEAALKLARRWGTTTKSADAYEVICLENSFHGRTLGSLSATMQGKYQEGFGPLVPGFKSVPAGDAEALAEAITPHTCAILLEVVQGEGGVRPLPPAYLQAVRRLTAAAGVLLIVDEVQSGMGRTGTWFAYQQAGIRPDIVTVAKALGQGLPIGACLARAEVASVLGPGSHASTFGGNPLVTATALAGIEAMIAAGLPEAAAASGQFLAGLLADLAAEEPGLGEVRGLGLMLGIQLHESLPVGEVVDAARAEGLLLTPAGGNTLRFLPPLNVTEAELREAVARLARALGRLSRRRAG